MLEIVEEERDSKTRYKFRQLARETSGEIFDIPEDNCVIIAYDFVKGKIAPIGGITFKLADILGAKYESQFTTDFHHHITFLFVRRDYQDKGIGTKLVEHAVQKMASHLPSRSVRVQSAMKAEGFFAKLGFIKRGDPLDIVYSGSHLFKILINMELKGGAQLQSKARMPRDNIDQSSSSTFEREALWE